MHLLLLKDSNNDLKKYKAQLLRWGITWEEKENDEFQWENEKISSTWATTFFADLFSAHAEKYDVVQFFLSKWKAPKNVVGQHYGKSFSGYRVCSVKIRTQDDKTAIHELMHAFWNIVWVYLGINLSDYMGVEDWDESVVHGKEKGFREYDYDETYFKIKHLVDGAIAKRKQLAQVALLEKLLILYRQLAMRNQTVNIPVPKSQKLYEAAIAHLGIDASPSDLAPDELGCAETASNIIRKIIPTFPITTGSWTLYDILQHHPEFKQVYYSQNDVVPCGTVIICATVPNKPFPGHVGIMGMNNEIMSNDSATGQFRRNYTLETWFNRWFKKGGYVVRFYELI